MGTLKSKRTKRLSTLLSCSNDKRRKIESNNLPNMDIICEVSKSFKSNIVSEDIRQQVGNKSSYQKSNTHISIPVEESLLTINSEIVAADNDIIVVNDNKEKLITCNNTLRDVLNGNQIKRKTTKKLLKSTPSSFDDDLEIIDEKIKTSEHTHDLLVNSMVNVKRTSLKELFTNFKKPESLDPILIPNNIEHKKPIQRFSDISALKEIKCSYPKYQKIDDVTSYMHHDLLLPHRRTILKSNILHTSEEYSFLKSIGENIPQIHKFIEFQVNYKLESSCWPQLFMPKNLKDVLLDSKLKDSVLFWIKTAFEKLKKPTKRSILLKKKYIIDDLDNFVVNDNLDEDNKDELEEFVPLMILYGTTGKNTLLEVIMKQLGGQIFEINTGENRSKRDILENMMEFSTTHFVRNKGSYGLILFDDVDVLFKEKDKFFWNVVEKTLYTSRRPVVLTCRDINFIPTSLIQITQDQKSLFHVEKVSHSAMKSYLHQCLKTIEIEIPDDILSEVINNSNDDVRHCLIQLQWICTRPGHIIYQDTNIETYSNTLQDYEKNMMLLSYTDVINAGSIKNSQIKQDIDITLYNSSKDDLKSDEDTVVNDYLIDFRNHIFDETKIELMPYELNISDFLYKNLPQISCSYLTKSNIFYEENLRVSLKFLLTRVSVYSLNGIKHSTNTRVTRSSRKAKEALNLSDYCIIDNEFEFNEYTLNFISTHKRSDISLYYFPIIYSIAQKDHATKEFNKQMFNIATTKAAPNATLEDILQDLIHKREIRPIFFKLDSSSVLKIWE